MTDRIEEIFDQVINEDCPDPLRRFAELVAEDAVAKEREVNRDLERSLKAVQKELLEALKEIIPKNLNLDNIFIPDHAVIPMHFTMGELKKIFAAIAKAEEQA